MSGRIVWLRALAAGSVGLGALEEWVAFDFWRRGNRPAAVAVAVAGVWLAAYFLAYLRRQARVAAGRGVSGAPPAA